VEREQITSQTVPEQREQIGTAGTDTAFPLKSLFRVMETDVPENVLFYTPGKNESVPELGNSSKAGKTKPLGYCGDDP